MIASGARVSVIGLGNMGSALAQALLNAGRQVTVWNRTAAKCAPLCAKGAVPAPSVAGAAANADIAIVCVSNHAATKALLFNDEVERALRGKLLVQLSTVSGGESIETAGWANRIGASHLEGSIIGFPSDITGGTATIVYAGPRVLFDANLEVLACLCRDSRHIGAAYGSAASLESAIYFFVYGVMISFIQGAAIAAARGIEVERYTGTVLSRLPNYPRRLGWLGDLIARRGHDEVQASLHIHAGAFAGSLAACREAGIDDTLPAALMHCMERAIAAGRGEQELTAIFEVLLHKPQ